MQGVIVIRVNEFRYFQAITIYTKKIQLFLNFIFLTTEDKDVNPFEQKKMEMATAALVISFESNPFEQTSQEITVTLLL